MTHCPRCGSDQIKPDKTMRAHDVAGKLIYYRCECRALFSRLNEAGASSPIAKPAYEPKAEA
jgi:hypothetical protein